MDALIKILDFEQGEKHQYFSIQNHKSINLMDSIHKGNYRFKFAMRLWENWAH